MMLCWCPAILLQVSLAGLWLMPAILSTLLKFWRFLFIWVCYSAITGYLMVQCTHKKMHHSTPRKVRHGGGWACFLPVHTCPDLGHACWFSHTHQNT